MSEGDEIFDVLCYGTISLDNVTWLPHLPNPLRDAVAKREYNELGGEALQVALALATWGLRVAVVGNVIGADWKGRFIQQELARYPNVDTRHLQCLAEIPTPFSRILVTPDGERSRIRYWYDTTPKVELTHDIMRQARLLSVDAYGQEERVRAARVARELGKPVISADAIYLDSPLAGLSDVVVISRAWLQYNFPTAFDYDHALDLQKQGAGVIIITDGPRPVLVVRADGVPFGIEPYTITGLVDTSGAGNLFKAGIIYGWLQSDWPLEQKVKFACAAAGLNCQRSCAHQSPPSLDDIARLMRSQPR